MNVTTESIARSIAAAVDDAFVNGSGIAPRPAGLVTVAGVHAVDATGDTSLDSFIAAGAAIEDDGGEVGAIVMSPSGWAAVAGFRLATGSSQNLIANMSTADQQRRGRW